ncbi:MAG: cell division/cell wall cluster transcriptional repressor MraZ [Spirochaetaceae bacterium]|nr:cell division/cell wall cluster transcriptional repressor MraZ [Spirochaetaceae bacterium]
MLESIEGQFPVTCDQKGRIMLPARLRAVYTESAMVVTKGYDRCLWLFSPSEWKRFAEKVVGNTAGSVKQSFAMQRHLLAPKQEIAFDKTGRLSIPQKLREYADLSKDGALHHINNFGVNFLELWDTAQSDAYDAQSQDDFNAGIENLARI